MHPDQAQLSAIGTTLDELTARITAMADRRAANPEQEAIAAGLYDVERSLQAAARRLAAIVRSIA